jgi:protein gp37
LGQKRLDLDIGVGKMNLTRIDWADFSMNPVRGYCPVDCKDLQGNSYCYARRMYNRYHWDKTIRFVPEVFAEIEKIKKPSRIFIGSTIELFDKWVNDEWMDMILFNVKLYPQHRFIFLSKRVWNLKKWTFPDNCYVGISAPKQSLQGDLFELGEVKAKTRIVSFEPLLDYTPCDLRYVNWAIIGARTPHSTKTDPRLIWLMDIAQRAKELRIPLFLKNNLMPMLTEFGEKNSCSKQEALVLETLYDGDKLRQELPNV